MITYLHNYNGGAKDGITVHDVVSALKFYLKSFDECIFTEKLLARFISTNNAHRERNVRLKIIKELLAEMPEVNYRTLKRLIGHFSS